MSGGGGSTTVQNNAPWPGVQPLLNKTYGMAGDALDQRLPYYPNQTFANFTPLQEMGMLGGLGYAQNQMAPQVAGLQGTLNQYMRAPLNITNDPAVQNMMAANRGEVTDWLTRDALPGIGTGAVAAGQYGGSRQGIAEGLAVGEGARALADANARTALGAYGTASGLASNAVSAMPSALQMGFIPTDYMQQVGGQYQGQYQRAIDDAMARYYYPEQSLWNALNSTSGIVSGMGGIGGTQTSSTKGPGTDWGSAALGAGLLFLSDRRLKEDIQEAFKDTKGRQWYRFKYKDPVQYGHGERLGVMADEILDTDPDAVITLPNGYYAVDYGRL